MKWIAQQPRFVILFIVTIIIGVGSSVLYGMYQPSLPTPRVIGYSEGTSWIDTGLKVVIFPDGHGYVARYQDDPNQRAAKVVRVSLTSEEQEALEQTFQVVNFFTLPMTITTNVTDGWSRYIFYANGNQYHKIHNYTTPHPATDQIHQSITNLFLEKWQTGIQVPFDVVLADARAQITEHKNTPEVQKCIKEAMNTMLHQLLGSDLFEIEDVADLFISDREW